MSGTRLLNPAHWGRRRILLGIALVVVLAIVATVFLTRPSQASEQIGLQTINVQMGADTSITSVRTASVTQDEDGNAAETTVDLDPTESAADLPVRVQTSWWHDGQSGSDLSALDGESGRFVVQVSVQDLTAEATELSFEADGARYRQQALVGVPLTVVASAEVDGSDRVVQVDDGTVEDGRITNGVLVETTDTGRSVQWAAFLAPPMLSATADFTLVIDTEDFQTPDFDITVQPGLVTDPSVSALVDRAFGSDGYSAQLESSTIELVQNVNSQLAEALEFVDTVHTTLEQDVAQLGEQTYSDLESSSQTVLSHLESTATELESILTSASSGINQVGSQTHAGVAALSQSLNNILGSTSTKPELTQTTIEGCSATMPTLAEGQTRTVASTVYLADAQLQAIVDLFAAGEDASSNNCRTALHNLVQGTIGDPSSLVDGTDAMNQCLATDANQRTVACTLSVARTTLSENFLDLVAASGSVIESYNALGIDDLTEVLGGTDGLAASLTTLREQLNQAQTGAALLSGQVSDWAQGTLSVMTQAQNSVTEARTSLEEISTAVSTLRAARDGLYDSLFEGVNSVGGNLEMIVDASTATVPVGKWFADSAYATALTDLVTQLNSRGETCRTDWASQIQEDSSADDILNALGNLDVSSCSAQALAVATKNIVTGYADTAASAASMGQQASTAQAALDGLDEQFDALDGALSDLEQTTSATSALEDALSQLVDPTGESGTLVDLNTRVQDIATLAESDGGLADLQEALTTLSELSTSIWPNNTVTPIADAATCEDYDQFDLGNRPEAVGQDVVWIGNHLLCLNEQVGNQLSGLSDQITAAATESDTQLALTSQQTQNALDQAEAAIDQLSDSLVTEVTTQKNSATQSSLQMIEDSQDQLDAETKEILASYDLTSSQVLAQLSESMQRSAAQSTAVAESLNEDFADLLANLGSPDPTSQGGMLGKLHSITTQVGETGTVLDSVGSTTTSYANVRAGELRDINLRAAQFEAAEQRLEEYQPFAQVDVADDLETVFVFQLREGN